VDLVHFLTPHIATILRPHFRDIPCVTTIHHVEDEKSFEPEPQSDAVMTVCRQWHDDLVRRGVEPEKLVMIPNGIDTQQFRPCQGSEQERLRAQFGIPTGAVSVGFSAKKSSDTHNRKGTDTLVRAVVELCRVRSDLVIVMIGPGWGEVVEQQARQGVKCISLPFLLEREDVARVHRCLDVFWVTSRIEGGPVPLLEAMSSGTCCVTTPVGVVPDLVQDGENAFLAPFDASDKFVQLTTQLASDQALRKRMGAAARATILEDYQWSKTTASARLLYQTAIDRFISRRPGVNTPRIPPDTIRRIRPIGFEALSAIPKSLRTSVVVEEHLEFMRALVRMGEGEAAAKIAMRALARSPLSRAAWEQTRAVLESNQAYRAATYLPRKARAVARRVKGLIGRAAPRSLPP
jgi:hypothetical protein